MEDNGFVVVDHPGKTRYPCIGEAKNMRSQTIRTRAHRVPRESKRLAFSNGFLWRWQRVSEAPRRRGSGHGRVAVRRRPVSHVADKDGWTQRDPCSWCPRKRQVDACGVRHPTPSRGVGGGLWIPSTYRLHKQHLGLPRQGLHRAAPLPDAQSRPRRTCLLGRSRRQR